MRVSRVARQVGLSGVLALALISMTATAATAAPSSGRTAPPPANSAHANALPKPPPPPTGVRPDTASPSVCMNAHVENIGWQGWVCGAGIEVGTEGQGLQMEALEIISYSTGGFCAQAHVENIGWMGMDCEPDGSEVDVGTTGLALRMEAVRLEIGTGVLRAGTCAGPRLAEGHVQRRWPGH